MHDGAFCMISTAKGNEEVDGHIKAVMGRLQSLNVRCTTLSPFAGGLVNSIRSVH